VDPELQGGKVTEYKLSIDKHHLDTECLRQVDMRQSIGFDMVAAENQAAAAKAARDLLHAQLMQIAQQEPGQLGLVGRPTVDAIRAAVECDKEYQERDAEYREAATQLALLRAADRVLDDRRRMLEHLVQLHGRDYWAEPRVSAADAMRVTDNNVAAALGSGVVRRRKGAT
jgi:hypothetical protein